MKEYNIKNRLFCICLVCIALLSGCNKDEKIVVNMPEPTSAANQKVDNGSKVSSIEEIIGKEDTEKLKSRQISDYINFVDKKYTKFWDALKSNVIDGYYNNDTYLKGSVRSYDEKNSNYYVDWYEETYYTFLDIAKVIKSEQKDNLSDQNERFMSYLDGYSNFIDGVFGSNNSYDILTTKSENKAFSYEEMEKIREYTVLLKQYKYLLKGEVKFTHIEGYMNENTGDETETNSSGTDNSDGKTKSLGLAVETIVMPEDEIPVYNTPDSNIALKYVTNVQLQNIIQDKYYKTLKKYSEITGSDKEKLKMAREYSEYWVTEYKRLTKKLSGMLKDKEKTVYDKMVKDWTDYMEVAGIIQNEILKDSDEYSTMMKKNAQADVFRANAEAYRQQCIEMIEMIYIMDGSIVV